MSSSGAAQVTVRSESTTDGWVVVREYLPWRARSSWDQPRSDFAYDHLDATLKPVELTPLLDEFDAW